MKNDSISKKQVFDKAVSVLMDTLKEAGIAEAVIVGAGYTEFSNKPAPDGSDVIIRHVMISSFGSDELTPFLASKISKLI